MTKKDAPADQIVDETKPYIPRETNVFLKALAMGVAAFIATLGAYAIYPILMDALGGSISGWLL